MNVSKNFQRLINQASPATQELLAYMRKQIELGISSHPELFNHEERILFLAKHLIEGGADSAALMRVLRGAFGLSLKEARQYEELASWMWRGHTPTCKGLS